MTRKEWENAKFNLRLPGRLKTQLAIEAEQNRRSLNNEIVQRLERSFQGYRSDLRRP